MPGAGLYQVGRGKTFSTIAGAMAQLLTDQGATPFGATQEIRIFKGTYYESVIWSATLVPTVANRLWVRGYPGEDVVIDGYGTIINVINPRSHSTIDNLRIRRGNGQGISALYGNVDITVRYCSVYDMPSGIGIYFSAAGGLNAGHLVHNCFSSSQTPLDFAGVDNCAAYNNTIIGGGLVLATSPANFIAKNNIIVALNYAAAFSIGTLTPLSTMITDYNLVWLAGGINTPYAHVVSTNYASRAAYRAFLSGGGYPDQEVNSIEANPGFICGGFANISDYLSTQIQAKGSPAMGVGTDLTSIIGSLDRLQKTRNIPMDMGCFNRFTRTLAARGF